MWQFFIRFKDSGKRDMIFGYYLEDALKDEGLFEEFLKGNIVCEGEFYMD